MIGREDEIREYRRRANLFTVFVFLACSALGARLFFLQVLNGEELRKFSEANRLKKERLYSTRGIFYDRHGKIIVDNRASFDVVMLTQYYDFAPETNLRLAEALKMPLPELEKKLSKVNRSPSFYPILLKSDVDKDVLAALAMDAQGFPGVDIETNVQRRYPYGDLGAQLLGYTGEVTPNDIRNDVKKELLLGDYIGKMGIERTFDANLRGQNGTGYVEVDAMGRRRKVEGNERLLGYVSQKEPTQGNNLTLTIDADLQAAAGHAMRSRGFEGSVVALDPRSGEILALVNFPSYNPGDISGREINPKVWQELSTSKSRPMRNRSVQDHYPPGSTFKLFLSIAALAEKVVTPNTQINCNGHLQFGNRRFHCWKRHGTVDFVKSIRESCDVYYYLLSNQLGVDRIAKYARMFGLGQSTGLKIGSESRGLIPDQEWKKKTYKDIWHPGETLSVSIGQGYVEVTPLQLVAAYAAIANNGFLYRPFIVKRIENREGETVKDYQPELVRKIDLPEEVFELTKEGLFQVANAPGGTAIVSGHSKITEISGKTGTAQVRAFADIMSTKCEKMPYEYRHHGWFVGYAPRKNPQIAVVALAEHSCHGTAGAPLVRDVIEAYLTKQAALAGDVLPADVLHTKGLQKASRVAAAQVEKKKEEAALEENEEGLAPPPVELNAPKSEGGE